MVNKKIRGRHIAEDIMDQCCHLSKFVGTVTSIRKICRLREGITFIKDFLNKFVNPLGIYIKIILLYEEKGEGEEMLQLNGFVHGTIYKTNTCYVKL